MKLKRLVILSLAIILALGLVSPALAAGPSLANFVASGSYYRGKYTDVNEQLWYGDNGQQVIRTCYELGLMEGVEYDRFAPEGTLTIAQAVTMAARVRNIYEGGSGKFAQGDPWYRVYFDYAIEKGVIPKSFFRGQETEIARRNEMAYIFAHALPESELKTINAVTSLPDVDWRVSFAEEIYRLYCAGILTGNDEYGSFAPDDTITRAAAAAIVSRLVVPAKRQSLSLTPEPPQWLEKYTNAQVLRYFNQTAYSSNKGERTFNVRWMKPIFYYIGGVPSYQDLNTFNSIRDRLNSMKNFPGMDPVGSTTWANMQVYFVARDKFGDYVKNVPAGAKSYTLLNYDASGALTGSVLLIANEFPTRLAKDAAIYKEFLRSMGLYYTTFDYPESVLYTDGSNQGFAADIDWALMSILYDPAMPSGMASDAGAAAAQRIIAARGNAYDPPTPTATPEPTPTPTPAPTPAPVAET